MTHPRKASNAFENAVDTDNAIRVIHPKILAFGNMAHPKASNPLQSNHHDAAFAFGNDDDADDAKDNLAAMQEEIMRIAHVQQGGFFQIKPKSGPTFDNLAIFDIFELLIGFEQQKHKKSPFVSLRI